eukprot:PhF_6_TR42933/c2_g1_i1/m.65177
MSSVSESVVVEIIELVNEDADNISKIKDKLDVLGQPAAGRSLTTVSEKLGMSPLYVACTTGSLATSQKLQYVQLMLLYSANPNSVGDRKGNTPLHGAAMNLHFFTVILLRRYGASLTALNNERRTPFHLSREREPKEALQDSRLKFCSVITTKIISIIKNENGEPFGSNDISELFIAIQCGEPNRVQRVLNAKPNAISQTFKRWTPLHLAVALMNKPIISVLVKTPGIDFNAKDEDGWTVINWIVALRVVFPDSEELMMDILKLIEAAASNNIQYFPRVCNSTFMQPLLLNQCFVMEVAPDWKGKTQEKKSYAFYFNKSEPSEELGVERYQVMMYYDGNPAEDVIGLFEPKSRRKITFRRRGNNELLLMEKDSIVFYDDQNGLITTESPGSHLDPNASRWAKSHWTSDKKWGLIRVPSFLGSMGQQYKDHLFVAGDIEFKVTSIERVSPSLEIYQLEVPEKQGLWMLNVTRTKLELAGTNEFETKLLFKFDNKIVFDCPITALQLKKVNTPTKIPLSEVCVGPSPLHWAAAEGLGTWVKLLLEKKECNPFDSGTDGKSPYLLSMIQLKDAEDGLKSIETSMSTLQENIKANRDTLALAEKGSMADKEEEVIQQEKELAMLRGQAASIQESVKLYRGIIDAIKTNKRCLDKVLNELKAEYKKPTTNQVSFLYALYDMDLPPKYLQEANDMFGVTNSQEAKMYLLNNATAIGNVGAMKRIMELNKLEKKDADDGRKLNNEGLKEYPMAVAAKFGKLDAIRYLTDERCRLDVGEGAVLREAMKAGNTTVATWVLENQPPPPPGRGGSAMSGCLPSAAGSPGANDGTVSVIPRVEEIKFCSEKGLVSSYYLENLLMRSYAWDTAEDPDEGTSAARGTGTALVLVGFQNDLFEYHANAPDGSSPAVPIPGTNASYCARLSQFLEDCMLNRTTLKVDYIVCVVNWLPEYHCTFIGDDEGSAYRDPFTGKLPPKRPRNCVQNTWGAEIHPCVFDVVGDIAKITRAGTDIAVDIQSAFFENNQLARTPLHDLLQSLNVSRVVVAGLPFESSIQYTVADALYLGYDVVVVEDMCPSRIEDKKDKARIDMKRRGARVVRERTIKKSFANTENRSKTPRDKKPMSKSMINAIRFLLNTENIRYYHVFERGAVSQNFREMLDGFDFGSGPRAGELFLYLSNFCAVRGKDAFNRGFTIESMKIETGDYESMRYPLHYLLMRTKFAPSGMDRRAAKNLLIKVVNFINRTPTVPLDVNGDPMVRFPSEATPKDFATTYPRSPCPKRIEEALGLNGEERCKCIFHAPLRAFKPKTEEEKLAQLEEVKLWDLWNPDFFSEGAEVDLSRPDVLMKIQRPHCPVGMKMHRTPNIPNSSKPSPGDDCVELQHILCCPPLQLAVRLNLYEIVEEMVNDVKDAGLMRGSRKSGKDKTGETFMYEEYEDVWQAIPYQRKTDGTLVQSGTPALHFSLRAMRKPALETIPSIRGALMGCIKPGMNGRKERSMIEFMKTILKRDQRKEKQANDEEDENSDDDDEGEDEGDLVIPIPIQDTPRDIAKGTAPMIYAGTVIPAWNIEEQLPLELYSKYTHDETELIPSEEERKVVWKINVEQQWLCPCCGCVGAEVVPSEENSNANYVYRLVEYLSALRVSANLIKSSSLHECVVQLGGENVRRIRIDIGPNMEKLIGSMYDRAGVFEVSGNGWVPQLQQYQSGDSGLSLVLQYAPQLIELMKTLDLFDKCPIESYDDFNNLVNNSNAAILIQQRHLWKASRGGVELAVYDKGLSLLHWAALLDDDVFAKLLIDWGANPLMTPMSSRLGYTPLHYACYSASMDTLTRIIENIKEEQSAEHAEQYVNIQALPRVVDEGFLTYNALFVSPEEGKQTHPTIRNIMLEDRAIDPCAWPHPTRYDKVKDRQTPYTFYGPVNTLGETALHVAAKFCHTMCITELVENYQAEIDYRNALEGFDVHDVAIALEHKSMLQTVEDTMLNKSKSAVELDNEEKDRNTLQEMCAFLNTQPEVLNKLEAFAVQYFWKDAFSYVVFVLVLTLYGFLLLDIPQTHGEYWSNNAITSSVLGANFKIDFTKSYAAGAPGPDVGSQSAATSADLGSLGDVITWIKGPFRDNLFSVPDGANMSSIFVVENKYLLAGAARVVALRVQNQTNCDIPSIYSNVAQTCYAEYSPSSALQKDKILTDDSGNVTWTFPFQYWRHNNELFDALQGWVGMQSYITELYYPTDNGNYLDFTPASAADLDSKFALVDSLLTDEVRFVTIYFNLYCVNTNRFVHVALFFESPMQGGLALTSTVTSFRLNRYQIAIDWFKLFLELVILMYMVKFFNEEIVQMYYTSTKIFARLKVLRMREHEKALEIEASAKSDERQAKKLEQPRRDGNPIINYNTVSQIMQKGYAVKDLSAKRARYEVTERKKKGDRPFPRMKVCPARLRGAKTFKNSVTMQRINIVYEELAYHFAHDFNFFDTVVLVLLSLCVGYHSYMFTVESNLEPSSVFDPSRGFIYEFGQIAYFQDTEQKIFSFVVLVCWVKSLKHIRFLPGMGPVASAITGTVGSSQIGTFVVILMLVILGFVFCCHFAFQKSVEGLKTFRSSFFFVVRTVVGDMDYDSLQQGSIHLGPFIWFLIASFCIIMLLNILIAVIGNVYDELIEETIADWSMAISRKYREEVLGLPSVEQPYGSIIVQQWYRVMGLCSSYYRRKYLKNRFIKIPYELREELDKENITFLRPHLRSWDAVSSSVVERMEEHNRKTNLSNQDLLEDLTDYHEDLVHRVRELDGVVEQVRKNMNEQTQDIKLTLSEVLKQIDKLSTRVATLTK